MNKEYKHNWYIKNRERILNKLASQVKEKQKERQVTLVCPVCKKKFKSSDKREKYCGKSACKKKANFTRGYKFRNSNKEYLKEYYRNYDMVNAELRKITGRSGHLRRKYGITPNDYNHMFVEQDGKCAICGKEEKLNVDHNHITNKVRKLLCFHCNAGLGHFKDNPDLLVKAAEYIKSSTLT